MPQIIAKLSPRGVAFLHHSNLGMLGGMASVDHGRGATVSAEAMRAFVSQAGGHVLRQEIIPWGSTDLLDCLTLFARQGAYGQATSIVVNSHFFEEAALVRSAIAPWRFEPSG